MVEIKKGRNKSRLGLKNWRKKRTIRFFEISEKPDFWTLFIRNYGL